MAKFTFTGTGIAGLTIIESTVFGDERGYFMETFQKEEFRAAGLPVDFVQDNQSKSKRGVLRGLHFQKTNPQGKLVRIIAGEVFDVAVDLRGGSPTCGQWRGVVLNAENKKQLYVPEGFAHGFVVLSEFAEFTYKCTRLYDPGDEAGIIWNDAELGIDWHLGGVVPVLSDKDTGLPALKDMEFRF
ncbi:dTDP-4-dehydrorhamnose 3,5-epimerase [Spirochaetia bacterium]|nr:dTDP-4-dehydrorhamnose 3,5-epimerase [Spirochaetia bacterium]